MSLQVVINTTARATLAKALNDLCALGVPVLAETQAVYRESLALSGALASDNMS